MAGTRSLSVVTPTSDADPAEAIRQMQAQARAGAMGLANGLADHADRLIAEADAIYRLGDALPAGVRDAARRLAEALGSHTITLRQIMGRQK